jgi:putative solute:sodium symporter small subunit
MAANPRRWRIALGLWAVFGLFVHAAAPTLNGLKLGGLPLGYWLAAQGAPILLLALGLLLRARGTSQPSRPEPTITDVVRF